MDWHYLAAMLWRNFNLSGADTSIRKKKKTSTYQVRSKHVVCVVRLKTNITIKVYLKVLKSKLTTNLKKR